MTLIDNKKYPDRLQGNVAFSLIWQWPELGLNTAVSGHGI